jgi:hypothetical protein
MESSSYIGVAGTQPTDDIKDIAHCDRRGVERYRTVCRIARVQRANDAGLWRVRNISNEGLMLAADTPATVGEMLDISLSETTTMRGTIVWTKRGFCGVAFDRPIDVAAVLRRLAEEQRSEGYRALRLPVEAQAVIALRDDARPIDLVDISQHGAGFLYDQVLDPGTEVELILPGGDVRRRALVRWSRGHRGGLWFAQQLDRTALESMTLLRR